MEFKINLVHNNGFKWFGSRTLHVKGYAHTTQGEYIQGPSLFKYLANTLTGAESVRETAKGLNGVYTFIFIAEETLFLFSDKTRFFPIYYHLNGQTVSVTDEPVTLISEKDRLDKISCAEYQCTGFVTGSDTLIEDIKQVGAAALINFNGDKISQENQFSYRVSLDQLKHYKDPCNEMKLTMDNAATRFINSIGDNTPVVPLSGGFDSRLIACILKERGYENTVCYTFGKYNKEVEISKRVAEKLGFKWYFIDYSEIETKRNLLNLEDFHSYYPYASRLTSMFFLMEYTALEVLRNKALIPDNSVFLPGHSGDLLGGSQFIKNFKTNIQPNEIASQILKTKYIYYPIPNKQKSVFKARVNSSLAIDEDSLGYSIMEDWDIKEKIAKFIFNASQVYTYFGYNARFFFWDRDLVEFFRTLPPEHKEYKILYDRCVKTNYFEKFNLNFEDEIVVSPKALNFQKIKELLKPWLPARAKQYFMRRNDWCCYKEMSTPMSKEIPVRKMKFLPYLSYSSILINWYLYKIEKLINNFQNF